MKKFFKKELKKPFTIVAFSTICLFKAIKLLEPLPLTIHALQTSQFQVSGTGSVTKGQNTALLMFNVIKSVSMVVYAQNKYNY